MFDNNPFNVIKIWLEDEERAGAPNPKQGILSTSTLGAVSHSRVVTYVKYK